MNKRNIWKYEETKEMLQIMQDNNYARSFTSKHRQNMEIYRSIENKMIESGFPYKNYLQIGVRWKNLKNLYTKAKRSNSKNEQQLFPYYEEMHNLLNGMPKKTSSEEYLCTCEQEETNVKADNAPTQLNDSVNDTAPKPDTPPVNSKRKLPIAPKTVSASKLRMRHDLTQPYRSERNSRVKKTIATSKQELSDEFYRTQKRLIDYEFKLYARMEEEFIDRIQVATRTMLDDSMDTFFTRLKDALDNQTVQHEEVMETFE